MNDDFTIKNGVVDLARIEYRGAVAERKRIRLDAPIVNYRNSTMFVTCTDGVVTLRDC